MLYPGIRSNCNQHEEYRSVVVERVHVYEAAGIYHKSKSHSDSSKKEYQYGYQYTSGKPQVSVIMYLRYISMAKVAYGQCHMQEKNHSQYLVVFKPCTAGFQFVKYVHNGLSALFFSMLSRQNVHYRQ